MSRFEASRGHVDMPRFRKLKAIASPVQEPYQDESAERTAADQD